MAAVLDVIVISMASGAIVLVMIISAVVVLFEEDQKRVETDIYRSVKVLDTILKPVHPDMEITIPASSLAVHVASTMLAANDCNRCKGGR